MLDAIASKPVPSGSMTRGHLVQFVSRFGRFLTATLALGAMVLVIAGPGCSSDGIGDPCTPEQEYNPNFLGFDVKEVSVESKSFQCRTRLCLVNHFQGRVTCPYGQDVAGNPPSSTAKACSVPGSNEAVSGLKECVTAEKKPFDTAKSCSKDEDCGVAGATCDFVDTRKGSTVQPQCLDRNTANSVYCSCRCADINGQRPSDQTFCDCPSGFACERLVTSIGQGDEGLTGSYCIKTNTKFDPSLGCPSGTCGSKPGDCDTK